MQYWKLTFDGSKFDLEPAKDSLGALARDRATEEQVETILSHWGHVLLPGAPVQIISRQSTIMVTADLAGLDAFGRLHLFEIKSGSPVTAGPEELHQALSYMINRTTTEHGLKEALAATIWYGRRSMAAQLGGLVARSHLGTTRGDDVPGDARYPVRAAGLLDRAAREATARIKRPVTRELLEGLAGQEMRRRFGVDHDGPLDDVDRLWEQFRAEQLGARWAFSDTSVVWLIAPSVEPALKVAEPLLARGIDLRFVELDVRELKPGRSWSIAIGFPAGTPWVGPERIQTALRSAADAHSNRHKDRLGPSARISCGHRAFSAHGGNIGWNGLAAAALVQLAFHSDHATWKWYSHWWTEGQALQYRKKMNAIRGHLLGKCARKLPWDPAQADGGAAFQTALADLLDTAWGRIVEIGAADADPWAVFKAADGADGADNQ
jgi:hypothetical protein